MKIQIDVETFFELWRMLGRIESLLYVNKLPSEIVDESAQKLTDAWDISLKALKGE